MLALWIALQLAGLGLALVALFAQWHFGILVAGVVVFLLGGRQVRRELAARSRAA